MVRHCGDFVLHVLAWDDAVLDWIDEAPRNVLGIGTGEFFTFRNNLKLTSLPGPQRSRVEHMWTCGPAHVAMVMERTGQPVTYIDADLFAFGSPEPFFAEAGDAPAAFCGHNFAHVADGLPGPTWESHAGLFGELNVGLCHFRDIRVAQRWAELCREWCYLKPDGVIEVHDTERPSRVVAQRFGDQKYLEQLVREFGAVVIKNKAAMIGPWNIHTASLQVLDGVPHFGGVPIGFYHFSGLRLGPHGQWSPSRPEYQINEAQVDALYVPYLRALEESSR